MSSPAPGGVTAVEAFWEMMDFVGPPPPRIHEIHGVMRKLVEQERWADAMLMAMVRDRQHHMDQETRGVRPTVCTCHRAPQSAADEGAVLPPGWVRLEAPPPPPPPREELRKHPPEWEKKSPPPATPPSLTPLVALDWREA